MKTYQVGGSVRDELLGVEPHDKDWADTKKTLSFLMFFIKILKM